MSGEFPRRPADHGGWLVIHDGPHAGMPHMSGWSWEPVEGISSDVVFGTCPRCGAAVASHPGNDQEEWFHERWHALTDHPLPADVLTALTPELQALYTPPARAIAAHPIAPWAGQPVYTRIYHRLFRSVPLARDFPLHALCGTCAAPITRANAGQPWQHVPSEERP